MSRSSTLLGLALTTPLLAACCTGVTTDPRRGGLAGGVCGTTTGAYEHRLATRREELAGLEAADVGLRARLAATQAEASDLQGRIAMAARRADARQAAVTAADADIERLRARRSTSSAELARIEAERDQLSRELAGHMERAHATEMASRSLREGATASIDRRTLESAAARDREDGEKLDRRLSDLRKAISQAGTE